ncbi:hypothetical protein [Prevotella sp. OH937_COT-195]|uniref:hypothetical protein n=1 Tax=Prevotella sp. OH937_COT-195 TaxID=2491051 RepID=UPI000F6473E6|nr:hypothetical protein [Prevotella sp. OH937_COT-195]RRC99092.1 hypothetical protein EII32_08650 [Prevotella sp. OH937_COT-195]
MKIKKSIMMVLLALITSSAMAQKLKLIKFIPENKNPKETLGLTFSNKPNGTFYRLREDIKVKFLKPTPRTCNMEQIITGETEFGYYAMYRNSLGSSEYSFILTLYNEKADMFDEIDLNEVSDNYNCEIQDLRYENGRVYYNFACPSYSSGLNGACSSLYCLDITKKEVLWSTPYLTSNDIFIIYGDYIICGYGFTNEKDYLFLVRKKDGKVLSKVLLRSACQYIEVKDNRIYAIDHQENAYTFVISNK